VPDFQVVAPFEPSGDQPEAIVELTRGIDEGVRRQTLVGVTGSGKTFTMAKVIEAVQKPTLIMAPNKTLAAQLATELRQFLPHNAVMYFVSYYDYYQPEAYVPQTDTYIEKDADINEEVERLRHAATAALLSRRDVVVVASVSAIYGIGSPREYAAQSVLLTRATQYDRDRLIRDLVQIQYDRNDYEVQSGTFRVRGDVVDILPPYAERPVRVEFFGDEIDALRVFDPVTGEVTAEFTSLPIWPASHYVTPPDKLERALGTIADELRERVAEFESAGKLLEALRLEMRTTYDLEMLKELGGV
jgi:excinuclease ABC subunit B